MLPLLTTAEDVRGIVKYLKNKPTGATIAEAKAAVSKLLDPRKVNAYIFWNIVQREGEKVKLTSRGWELARKPQQEVEVFRAIIDSIVPYHSAIEWIHHQNFKSVTTNDVAVHWHEHHGDAAGKSNETTLKDGAICFFHLSDAAQFGKLVIGRRGQPTRLEVNQTELEKHIEAGPSAPPLDEATEDVVIAEAARVETSIPAPTATQTDAPPKRVRVFIAHGKNIKIVEQVQTMLDLASIDAEVAEDEESVAIPVPDKVFGAMHRCTAGVIVVSAEEGRKDAKGGYLLNDNVLIEIGAAYVLYDRRIVLLWDKRLPIPSNLQGLYRCSFEGDELSWEAGMKLMKGVQNFKRATS
jgi:predicted nucleotide-binding protein